MQVATFDVEMETGRILLALYIRRGVTAAPGETGRLTYSPAVERPRRSRPESRLVWEDAMRS